jgi:hypothetical protein
MKIRQLRQANRDPFEVAVKLFGSKDMSRANNKMSITSTQCDST